MLPGPSAAATLICLTVFAIACTSDVRVGGEDPGSRPPDPPPTLAPDIAASIDPVVLEAIERSMEAVEREPSSYDRRLALGMDLAANGLHDTAISALESAARVDGADGRATYYLGLTHLESGRLEEAIRAFEAAAAASPERAQIWWRLGLSLLDAGRDADAAAAIDRALELDPASAPAWAGRGRLALADDRPQDALDAFQEALRLNPGAAGADERYLQGMSARALQRLGRTDEAEAAIAGATGSGAPSWADPWRDALVARSLGLAPAIGAAVQLAREGRPEAAITQLEVLRKEHPEEPAVLFDLGVAYGLAERFEDSAEILAELIRLEPERMDTHEQRARALVALAARRPGDERDDLLDEAIGHLDTVLDRAPDQSSAIALRADAHRLAGRIEAAAEDYALAGQRSGEPHQWTLIAADMYLQAGRWAPAVELLERMVADRPGHAEALRLLGAARAETGDLEGAAAALQDALDVQPDDAVAARLLERIESDARATAAAP